MAFFKTARKKKEDDDFFGAQMPELAAKPQSSSNSPVEQVVMMKQQGYTNNQIVQALQSQGYNTSDIFDAINRAGGGSEFEAAGQQQETGMPEYGQAYEEQDPYQQPQFQSLQAPREIQTPVSIDEERIQEVAEAIIDEKWRDLVKDIKKVIEWKDRTEDRVAKLEQQLIDVRLSVDTLTKSIMGKISGYDQNITDVGTEIKAMEKVFQKVLPTLTESVNKLDRMTKGYGKDQPVSKRL